MGLLKRMSCLITANLNDLIDQCEDPEKLIRQAVRDMETALGQLMDAAARAIAHHKLLQRQHQEQRDAIARCLKLAEAAVTRGDDDVARRHLLQKAEHQQLADGLSRQIETADALGQRLRRQVAAMRLKLAEARRKQVDITARNRAAAAQRTFIRNLSDEVCSVTGWSTFETMCDRVEQSESETEALLELLGEIDERATVDADIEAELQSLKEAASHVAT